MFCSVLIPSIVKVILDSPRRGFVTAAWPVGDILWNDYSCALVLSRAFIISTDPSRVLCLPTVMKLNCWMARVAMSSLPPPKTYFLWRLVQIILRDQPQIYTVPLWAPVDPSLHRKQAENYIKKYNVFKI
jgi:hypothetical protein